MSPALMPAVSAICAMLAAWKPLSMKHFSDASRMRSRCRAACVAAAGAGAAVRRMLATLRVLTLLTGGGPAAVFLPAAAKGLVQGHAIVLLRQPRRDQSLLRAVIAA